jgi:hypothetical protein
MPTKKEKIEKLFKVPCGPTDVDADGVCRKSLSPGMDKVMDRLTREVNQELPPPAKLPKGVTTDDSGKLMVDAAETPEEHRARLIEEGKLRAEVRHAVKQYQETLQGNSKLLQDITGKIQTR